MRGGGRSASRQLQQNSAAVLFLRNQSLRLSELGALDSRADAARDVLNQLAPYFDAGFNPLEPPARR